MLAWLVMCAPLVTAEDLQDPTQPSFYRSAPGEAQTAQSLVLTAIRITPVRRSAMINGRTFGVGDSVGDARVIAIGTGGVRLRRGSDQFTLQLLPIKVKQAAKATGQ